MNVAVCVPWRASDPHRARIWDYVRTHHLEPLGLPVIAADYCAHTPFSRAASRNLAASFALHDGADVLIFHDADTFLRTREQYSELARLAFNSGRLVLGADHLYRALDEKQTRRVLNQGHDPWSLYVTHPSLLRNVGNSWFPVGGVVALTVDAYCTVGGYDERFQGWGCEDTAFVKACRWLLPGSERPVLRAPGDMAQLWHPSDQHTAHPANTLLDNRYAWCESRDDMYALLTEPGGPLCSSSA